MSTLEARITEVIEVHKVRGWTSDGTHREMRCHPCGKTIGGAFPTIEALEKHHFAEVIAAMLAPVIAEAKVEALREAADELTGVIEDVQSGNRPNGVEWQTGALAMRDWLRATS